VGSTGLSVGHIIQRHVIVHVVGGLLLLQLVVVRVRHQVSVRATEVDAVARAERNRDAVAEALGLLQGAVVNTRDTCSDASSDASNAVRMRVHGVRVGPRGQCLAHRGEGDAYTLVAIGTWRESNKWKNREGNTAQNEVNCPVSNKRRSRRKQLTAAQIVLGVHYGHSDAHDLLHRREPAAQPQQTQRRGPEHNYKTMNGSQT